MKELDTVMQVAIAFIAGKQLGKKERAGHGNMSLSTTSPPGTPALPGDCCSLSVGKYRPCKRLGEKRPSTTPFEGNLDITAARPLTQDP